MNLITGAMAFRSKWTADVKTAEADLPVLICLLGSFRLLRSGQPVALRNAAKTKSLLAALALEHGRSVSREALLQLLWPDTDLNLAGQSLNSLVHNLRKLLSDKIGNEPPVLCTDGYYRLNDEAGVAVDAAWFETLVDAGRKQERAGDPVAAIESYRRAAQLYRGDLCVGTDMQALLAGESLRAHYLTLLARLADYSYTVGDYASCLEYARRLLSADPCREDAHRLVMRCCVRQDERSQALRQYRLCQTILRTEFNAVPEPATAALYEQIRTDPSRV
jgi:DNA-binding SARP family transcriptional activator